MTSLRRVETSREPVWPDISFEEILKIAFRDRYVDDVDHPLLQKLRGLV